MGVVFVAVVVAECGWLFLVVWVVVFGGVGGQECNLKFLMKCMFDLLLLLVL